MTRREWLGPGASFVLCFAAAAIGGTVVSGAWYEQLAKPDRTPSSVSATVWTILYGMMAVAARLVWKERGFSRVRLPLVRFALQLARTPRGHACFGHHRPGLALRGALNLGRFLMPGGASERSASQLVVGRERIIPAIDPESRRDQG